MKWVAPHVRSSDERIANLRAAPEEARIHIGGDGKAGIVKRDAFERARKLFLRRLHQRAMEWRAHRQHHRALRAGLLAQSGSAFHRSR